MKQLKVTTTKPYSIEDMLSDYEPELIITPPEDDVDIINMDKVKGSGACLYDDAERVAGFYIPIFFEGDMLQLDQSIEEQDILLLLSKEKHQCKAELNDDGQYYITLK